MQVFILSGVFLFPGILGASPYQVENLVREAQQAEKAGQLDDAVRLYREILERRPHWVAAEFRLALAYDAQSKYSESLTIMSEILRHDPLMSDAYLLQGKIFYETNQYENALGALKKVLNLQPKNDHVHFFLAATYYQLGDYSQAALDYLEQIQIQPKQAEFYFQLVQCYEALIRQTLDKLYESPDASYFALLLEAENDIGRNDFISAEQQLRAASEDNPSAPEAWLIQGKKEEREGQFTPARASFSKAREKNIKDDPRFLGTIAADLGSDTLCPPRQGLASALCRAANGEFIVATRLVLEAKPAAGNDARGWYWKARIHQRLRQKTMSRLAQLDPNSPGLHKLYARGFIERGRSADAAREYEKALASDSQDASTFVEYANFRTSAQEFPQAIALLQKALDLAAADFNVRILLARAYVQGGEPASALPHFAEAMRALPNDEQLRIDFAECLYGLDRISEAIRLLEAAPTDHDGRIAYVLARYYSRLGDTEKADHAREIFRQQRDSALQGNFQH